MEPMTNQELANMALDADRSRRAAWARGDYQESCKQWEIRNDWILRMNYQIEIGKLRKVFA